MSLARPQRTCVGCRRVVSQDSVVRLALDGGRIVLDEGRRAPGRGAWVHRAKTCVDGAVRGGLARSFRRKVDPAALVRWGSDPALPATLDESALASGTEKS